MTDAQQALAQVREALADPMLFDWARDWDRARAIRAFERSCTTANIAAILAHVDAQAAEIERLTASLKRANETAEHFERHWYLRGDEIERLTAERNEARAERDAMRAALNTIARTPAMPFPDPGAHSERAYHEAVFVAWSRSNQTARAALAQIEQEKNSGSR